MTKPPINKELMEYKFPEYQVCNFGKKGKLYYYEDRTQPMLGINLMLSVGADRESKPGLAYFAASMLNKGTNKRSSAKIASELDFIGSGFYPNLSKDCTTFMLSGLAQFRNKMLDILFDCVMEPTFPDKEISKFRKKLCAEIQQNTFDPEELARIAFNATFYQQHSYSNPLYGTLKTVNSFSRQEIVSEYENMFANSEVNAVVAGYSDYEELCSVFSEFYSKIGTKTTKKLKKIAPPANASASPIVLVNKPDAAQTVLRIGMPALPRKHKDFPALFFANTVLGSFAGRFNSELREKLGYTYGVGTYISQKKHDSTMIISTSVNQEATAKSIKKIKDILNKFSCEKVKLREFEIAKHYILGAFLRNLQTPQQMASMLNSMITYELPNDYYSLYFKAIADMTIEDLFAVQEKYFNPEDMHIVAVGNEQLLEKQLESIGQTVKFDLTEYMN